MILKSVFPFLLLLATSIASAGRPNVIFILCDDLGWGDLGISYQNQRDTDRRHATPNLDRFASEGIQLRAHYRRESSVLSGGVRLGATNSARRRYGR